MKQKSKWAAMSFEECVENGLALLSPGQLWRTSMRDMVVAEVIPKTASVVFWSTASGSVGRLRKTKMRIDRFLIDNDPKLLR